MSPNGEDGIVVKQRKKFPTTGKLVKLSGTEINDLGFYKKLSQNGGCNVTLP